MYIWISDAVITLLIPNEITLSRCVFIPIRLFAMKHLTFVSRKSLCSTCRLNMYVDEYEHEGGSKIAFDLNSVNKFHVNFTHYANKSIWQICFGTPISRYVNIQPKHIVCNGAVRVFIDSVIRSPHHVLLSFANVYAQSTVSSFICECCVHFVAIEKQIWNFHNCFMVSLSTHNNKPNRIERKDPFYFANDNGQWFVAASFSLPKI